MYSHKKCAIMYIIKFEENLHMMIECPECKKQISDTAKSCPDCGCDVKLKLAQKKQEQKPAPKKWEEMSPNARGLAILGIIALVIIAIVVIYFATKGPDSDDGKCDICNETATYENGAGEEFCDEHYLDYLKWANKQ